MNYLGLPLGSSFKAKSVWNTIIEQVEQRVAGWNFQRITAAFPLCLFVTYIKSLPLSYQIFFFFFFGIDNEKKFINK